MKFKSKVPANVDPIELADRIKGNLTTRVLKDLERVKRAKVQRVKRF